MPLFFAPIGECTQGTECVYNSDGIRMLDGRRPAVAHPFISSPLRGKVILLQARSRRKDASTLGATDERPFYKRPPAQAAHRMQPP